MNRIPARPIGTKTANKLAAFVVAATAAAIMSMPAAACTTYMRVTNNTDVSINPMACATMAQGAEKWQTNASCVDYAISQSDRLDPGQTRGLEVLTSRKRHTLFKIRLTYKRGIGGPTRVADSDFRVCDDRHPIVIE